MVNYAVFYWLTRISHLICNCAAVCILKKDIYLKNWQEHHQMDKKFCIA